MRHHSWVIVSFVMLLGWLSSSTLLGQIDWDAFGGPSEISVTIEHPPGLDLQVQRVAFGQATGKCSEEIVDGLIAEFVGNGIEVIDRFHLEALMAEHKLSISGVVDRNSALELGKLLGPSALVFVKTRRCVAERSSYRTRSENVFKMDARLTGTVQIIDLTTARIDYAHPLDVHIPFRRSSPLDANPETVSQYQAIDRAIDSAVGSVRRLFFPWTESRNLAFYSGKTCNFKLAYNLVQANAYEDAREQSRQNLFACESFRAKKPKNVAKAYFNLGITHFLNDDYDSALEAFDQSIRLNPNKHASEAIAQTRRAVQIAEARKQFNAGVDSRSTADVEEALPTPSVTVPVHAEEKSLEERLTELKELFEKGLISHELYDKKVAEILEGM